MKNVKIKSILTIIIFVIATAFIANLTSCYSVFSGGTGGLIVDKESTSVPKNGIANVDVYAYLNNGERDSDYENYTEGSIFSPNADYYGHTTTDSSGHFSISKLTWKEKSPDFGRDGDYTEIYFLFYHENYGLTRGQTVIISDSTSDTVYAELTPIRKTTVLNLNFIDVASNTTTAQNIYTEISVPQATQNQPEMPPKIYKTTITGSGNITISYPRWKSDEDRKNETENTPEITITYIQSADEITWVGCYNGDNEEGNYAFRDDARTGIKKIIKNSSYSLNFYGKSQKISMPIINGQFLNENSDGMGTKDCDGILISLKQIDKNGKYTIDCGQVYTQSQNLGTSDKEKHGVFSNLGQGFTWTDTEYKGKFAETKVKIFALPAENPTESAAIKTKGLTIRSDSSPITIQF